jgi:hypothetical protein
MHLGLEPGPQCDQLGSVPHRLPQRPHRRWGDPRLGQPAHPQQVGQIRRVPDIVFDPPVGETLDAQRMRQMHLGAHRLQAVPT